MFGLLLGAIALAAGPAAAASGATYTLTNPVNMTAACDSQNAETIQASDPKANAVYEEWIGCNGIGYATSHDNGATWSAPRTLPGSTGQNGGRSWDPAVAVAPDGTVYESFMVSRSGLSYPVIDVSHDHGVTFKTAGASIPPDPKNWADRDFIAVAPDGTLYLTWDYGPSAAAVQFVCSPIGSCAFSAGDVNAVFQKSTDGGATWSKMTYISPGFPNSGADSAPITVEPDGTIDVIYQGYDVSNPPVDNLSVAYTYFSHSKDGGATWSAPVKIHPEVGSMNSTEWWIDGNMALGPDGTIYVTWDTQTATTDTGWLSFSTDHGATWSTPVQTAPDTLNIPHIMQVVAGPPGIVYVGWESNPDPRGYAQYLRTYSTTKGWLGPQVQVSTAFGTSSVWPGDTFGFSAQSPTRLVLAWGSAVSPTASKDDIFAAQVGVTLP